MSFARLAAALGLVAACGAEPELPPELAPWAEGCAGLSGEHRDWCALDALQRAVGLSQEQWFEACGGITTLAVRDQCYEAIIRRDARIGEKVCERIQDARFRDSCYLEWLRGVTVPSQMTLREALEACEKSGGYMEHCAVHVLQQWATTWPGRGGEAAMRQDIATTLQVEPSLAHSRSFGNSAGYFPAVHGYPKPCWMFPEGLGREACVGVAVDGSSPPAP